MKQAFFALLAIVVLATPVTSAGAQSAQSVTIPFSSRGGNRGLSISVGGGKPFRLLFDTGSEGLRVVAPMVGPNVRRTGIRVQYAYASGTIYHGEIAYAPVTIGPLTTATAIPIEIIDSESCLASQPNCPGRQGMENAMAHERYGTMGVRLGAAGKIPSPMAGFAAPYNAGFVVAGQRLIVGLPPALKRTFETVALASASPDPYVGDPAWNVNLNVTWRIGGRVVTGAPVSTLFDTGTGPVMLGLPADEIPQSWLEGRRLRDGVTVEASIPGKFDIRIRAGTMQGVNQVFVNTAKLSAYMNVGWLGFRDYDVMYDIAEGLIGFRPAR